jgi:hypothetical protein
MSPVQLLQSDPHPWVSDIDPMLGTMVDFCSDFHGNIQESNEVTACDCNGNSQRDLCDLEQGFSTDCNTNGVPDSCDAFACNDDNPCTTDSCAGTACQFVNNTNACDADGPCTVAGSGVCTAGQCVGTAIVELYGDVVSAFGVIDVDDLVCVLDDFVDPNNCVGDGDIFPCDPDGTVPYDHGDGINDVDDIAAVLQAFVGFNLCPHPCPP